MTNVSILVSKLTNKVFWFYNLARSKFLYGFTFKKFGSRSLIIKPILISNPHRMEIGDNVLIRNGARLEIILDGVNKSPTLSIGNNVNIEQNVHIVCHCSVRIGSNVSITANCVIVDTSHPFDDVPDGVKVGARISTDSSYVEIDDDCFIGVGACILPNVRIGKGSIIGSHSVVTKHIPPYSIVTGQPARVIRRRDRN